jgi:uncharacterized protein with gpF-like domain
MPILIDHKQIDKLRRRRARRPPKIDGSAQAERFLRTKLQKLWQRVLAPATKKIQRLAASSAPATEIVSAINSALDTAEMQYDIAAADISNQWRSSLDRDTRKAFVAGLQKSLGVDITALYDSPEIADALAIGSMEASQLIQTIPTEFLGKVAQAVSDNFTGEPLPEGRTLAQQIRVLSGQSLRRAKMIARDQTKKLNAHIQQVRQSSLGITAYIWRTVKDERVVGKPGGVSPTGNTAHRNHYKMEGVYCQWDDPTVYSKDDGKTWIKRVSEMPKNHPGQDINCRCHAEPVLDIEKILEYAQTA